jgi:Fic family protein
MENRRLETAMKMTVTTRNYQRARVRALTRLAKAHREEYKAYLEEEKQNDYTQGKAWLDIYGNTNNSMGANTRADTKASSRDTFREAQSRDNREDQGDLE